MHGILPEFPWPTHKDTAARAVRVRALDENGVVIYLDVSGEMAKCLCHEIDHLQGIVFIERALPY